MACWIAYLRHMASAHTRHGTHSPFVYKLLDEVIYRDAPSPSDQKNRIERLVERLVAHFGSANMLQIHGSRLPDSWPNDPDPSTVILYQGIYQNRQSKAGWRQIQRLPGITVTIDLFYLGLAFYKTDQAPEHFRIRF